MRTGALFAAALLVLSGNCLAAEAAAGRPPKQAFAAQTPPPAPDYSRAEAWLAWPGRPSSADVFPPNATPAAGPDAAADVFFIHPTTFGSSERWNATYDEGGETSTGLTDGVLPFQASVFNGCCRIYAPRYRQATFGAFLKPGKDAFAAFDLAYGDVRRAFEHYLAQAPQDRPIVLASHSQGSLHLTRLLRERVVNDSALRRRVVAAYLIGASLPERGTPLPVCASRLQTQCLLDWNAVVPRPLIAIAHGILPTWSDGRYRTIGIERIACVNPLLWTEQGNAESKDNPGALPGTFPAPGEALPRLLPEVTGARCVKGGLVVSVPDSLLEAFGGTGALGKIGSFHQADYLLFYASIRKNAIDRVEAHAARR